MTGAGIMPDVAAEIEPAMEFIAKAVPSSSVADQKLVNPDKVFSAYRIVKMSAYALFKFSSLVLLLLSMLFLLS